MKLSARYRLEERIGTGGMSTVYRAVDETLQRSVAVKVMNREVAEHSDQLERFRREARAVAQLSHPNVVGVIDAGDDAGHPYIVFEFVEGETLKQRIQRRGPLPVSEALSYAIEVTRALGAAHARQIVHRDVKPQNVLIDAEGKARVTDFGIARSLEEQGLTDDGRVVGTTDYVSPEQALGRPVTGQSDLYSLGIVLYEMLTGELPFSGETQIAVAMKHVREPLPDVRARRPEIPVALAAVVARATAKPLEERYPDEATLIADLERMLELQARGAEPDPREITAEMQSLAVRRRRRPAALLGASLAVLAVLAAGAWGVAQLLSHSSGGRGGSGRLVPVALCASCANAYNPFGYGGITTQNNANAPLAIDHNPKTGWSTEIYYTGALGKPGVGLYLYTGAAVVARSLRIVTSTPGFQAAIYATSSSPEAGSFPDSHWVLVARARSIAATTTIPLSGRVAHRYFLVWITQLPPHRRSASLNELTLFR